MGEAREILFPDKFLEIMHPKDIKSLAPMFEGKGRGVVKNKNAQTVHLRGFEPN